MNDLDAAQAAIYRVSSGLYGGDGGPTSDLTALVHQAELLLSEVSILRSQLADRDERLAKADDDLDHELAERDYRTDLLDKFAYTIGTISEIGEHTSANDPWANAYERLQDLLAQLAESQQENERLRTVRDDHCAQGCKLLDEAQDAHERMAEKYEREVLGP